MFLCVAPGPVPVRLDMLLQADSAGQRIACSSYQHNMLACLPPALYTAKWGAFSKWCDDSHVVPSHEVGSVLSFLQSQLKNGLAFSTVKVYAAAVSAGHVDCSLVIPWSTDSCEGLDV